MVVLGMRGSGCGGAMKRIISLQYCLLMCAQGVVV